MSLSSYCPDTISNTKTLKISFTFEYVLVIGVKGFSDENLFFEATYGEACQKPSQRPSSISRGNCHLIPALRYKASMNS